jgi:glycerophosphoryl diester phosphodiesterase
VTSEWLSRRVLHYAHQGGAKEAPSSTLYAFRTALAEGADALEMDVHLTADGTLVVAHDSTVDRPTPAQGRIDEFTVEELRALDFAYWWSPGHDAVTGLADHAYPLRGRSAENPELGVTLLSEVLRAFPDTFLNLDIKGGRLPYEQELADLLRAYGRTTDVIVASFQDEHLKRFRMIAPEVCTSTAAGESFTIAAAISQGQHLDLPASVVAMQVPYRFSPDAEPLFDATFVDLAHERGLAMHVWTIDDEAEMRNVLQTGVDGMMTDVPTLLEQVYREHQVKRWR